MNKCYLVISYILIMMSSAHVGKLIAHAGHNHSNGQTHDMQKITIRDDVVLDLSVPYEKILYGEIPHIYLGIKNDGDRPVQINTDFMFESTNQIVFEARTGDSGDNLTKPEYIPEWSKLNQRVESGQIGFESLNKGDSRIYARNGGKPRSQLSWGYDLLPQGTKEIRVSLLVGKNEWAFSDWVPIERYNGQKLHDAQVVETILEGTIREQQIRLATISGEQYLFLTGPNNGTRIAVVPAGATPHFEIEGENLERKLIIHFAGVDVPSVVHRIASIETLEGSSLTTPHLEMMSALEKRLEANDSKSGLSTSSTSEPDTQELQPKGQGASNPVQPNTAPVTTETSEPELASFPWLWIGAILVVTGVAVFLVFQRQRG